MDDSVAGGRSPEAVSTLPVELQVRSPVCDSIDQVKRESSVSLTLMPKAVPWPPLWTVIVKPIWLPITTGASWSASLAMPSTGQLTTMSASAVLFPSAPAGSLSAPIVTVLWSVPQSAKSVSPPMWMTITSPLARSPRSQWSTPPAIGSHGLAIGLPLRVTRPANQLTPAGSVSSRTTLTAVSGPLFVTVIENAAVSPALIGDDVGGLHDRDVGALDDDRRVVGVVAGGARGLIRGRDGDVVGSGPQSLPSTAPLIVMTTWLAAPTPSVAKSQVSVPAVIAQPATGGLIAQVTPAGRVSATWTFLATPGPALLTVIVKVAVSPGMIGPLPRLHDRDVRALDDDLRLGRVVAGQDCGSFVADTVTMFGSVPQSKWSVWPLTWITTLALAARLAKSQVSVPAAMAQPDEVDRHRGRHADLRLRQPGGQRQRRDPRGQTDHFDCGTLPNIVTVSATNEPQSATGNNSSQAEIVVLCPERGAGECRRRRRRE